VLRLAIGALVLSLLASNAAAALQLSGRLEWVRKVEMRAVENGVIAEVLVAPGEHVD
jgi:hypothetical protein